MSIYTKKGDKGETGLFSKIPGKPIRVEKDTQIIKTIGSVDEANSFLGIIVSETKDKKLVKSLQTIQRNLFTIGSILAGSDLKLDVNATAELEKLIDKIDANLPKLQNFILPGGHPVAAKLHFARTLVRRAERELVTLNQKKSQPPEILEYLNRLSDTLFMLARENNARLKITETVWHVADKDV